MDITKLTDDELEQLMYDAEVEFIRRDEIKKAQWEIDQKKQTERIAAREAKLRAEMGDKAYEDFSEQETLKFFAYLKSLSSDS